MNSSTSTSSTSILSTRNNCASNSTFTPRYTFLCSIVAIINLFHCLLAFVLLSYMHTWKLFTIIALFINLFVVLLAFVGIFWRKPYLLIPNITVKLFGNIFLLFIGFNIIDEITMRNTINDHHHIVYALLWISIGVFLFTTEIRLISIEWFDIIRSNARRCAPPPPPYAIVINTETPPPTYDQAIIVMQQQRDCRQLNAVQLQWKNTNT